MDKKLRIKKEFYELNYHQRIGVMKGVIAYLFLIPGMILTRYHLSFLILFGFGIGLIIQAYNDYFLKGKRMDNKKWD